MSASSAGRPFDPRLLRLVPQSRRPLLALAVTRVAAGAVAIGQAFAVSAVVVGVVRGRPVTGALVALVVLFVARGLLAALGELVSAWAGATVSARLREQLLARWLTRPADERPAPQRAMALATQGVASVEPYVARFLPTLVSAAVLPVLAMATLAVLDWPSALVVVLTVPLLPLFAALIGKTTAEQTARRWQAMAALSGHFLDVVRGLPTLVAYGRADRQRRSIEQVSERHRQSTVRTLRLAFLSSAALELLATISVAMVAVSTGLRLTTGSLELGVALTVILLAPEAYWPIRRVGAEFHAAADGAQALGEVFAELEVQPPVEAGAGASDAEPLVRVQDVTYTYPGSDRPVLASLNLVAGVGLTVVTGVSGVGKSTLLDLLGGIHRPELGTVHAPPAHLVTQRPFLAAGTVRENLLLGAAPGTDDARLWAALREVAMDGVVAGLPLGLSEPLGDDGFGLSAGQRSRLGLARAWLSDCSLLLLDEPIAHLDADTAATVTQVVHDLAATRAVVAVSHRLELADGAAQLVDLTPVEAAS